MTSGSLGAIAGTAERMFLGRASQAARSATGKFMRAGRRRRRDDACAEAVGGGQPDQTRLESTVLPPSSVANLSAVRRVQPLGLRASH